MADRPQDTKRPTSMTKSHAGVCALPGNIRASAQDLTKHVSPSFAKAMHIQIVGGSAVERRTLDAREARSKAFGKLSTSKSILFRLVPIRTPRLTSVRVRTYSGVQLITKRLSSSPCFSKGSNRIQVVDSKKLMMRASGHLRSLKAIA